MDTTRTVSTVSAQEAERFWGDGQPAYPAETNDNQADGIKAPKEESLRIVACCSGHDVPEAGGYVHAADCPLAERSANRPPSRPYVAGEVPPSLRRLIGSPFTEQDLFASRMAAELLFAARDLAENQIRPRGSSSLTAVYAPLTCSECLMVEVAGGLKHTVSCRAGRVFNVIDRLLEAAAGTPEFEPENLNRKEAAPAVETGHAGDGIRSRGVFGEPWRVEDRGDSAVLRDQEDDVVATISGPREIVSRIVDCVNSLAGLPDITHAYVVRGVKTGGAL